MFYPSCLHLFQFSISCHLHLWWQLIYRESEPCSFTGCLPCKRVAAYYGPLFGFKHTAEKSWREERNIGFYSACKGTMFIMGSGWIQGETNRLGFQSLLEADANTTQGKGLVAWFQEGISGSWGPALPCAVAEDSHPDLPTPCYSPFPLVKLCL